VLAEFYNLTYQSVDPSPRSQLNFKIILPFTPVSYNDEKRS